MKELTRRQHEVIEGWRLVLLHAAQDQAPATTQAVRARLPTPAQWESQRAAQKHLAAQRAQEMAREASQSVQAETGVQADPVPKDLKQKVLGREDNEETPSEEHKKE